MQSYCNSVEVVTYSGASRCCIGRHIVGMTNNGIMTDFGWTSINALAGRRSSNQMHTWVFQLVYKVGT